MWVHLCACVVTHTSTAGASPQCAGNRAPGAGGDCRLTEQAASLSLCTQHRNWVVLAHEKTHEACPGFWQATSRHWLSFCVVQTAPGWRDPDKCCWERAAAPCAAAQAIPLAAALGDSVCSLGSGILTPGHPGLPHGKQEHLGPF